MGSADFWKEGDWNAACSMCGRKRKASTLVRNWQGQWRCPEHNDTRQPQDFVRAVPENQTPPWVQPQTDTFQGAIACGNAGGSANALTLTPTVTCFGPLEGQTFQFTATANNTTAATLTVLGTTAAIELDGVALVAGDIDLGSVYQVSYIGGVFQLSSW